MPWFAWQSQADLDTLRSHYTKWRPDALVADSPETAVTLLGETDAAVLVEVDNPFGLALSEDVDLNAEFDKSPLEGEVAFAEFIARTRDSLANAVGCGADGVLYRVFGAEPTLSTPMQFGGLYLEQERELLSEIRDARFNIVFVEGGDETYLDVVSDLPAAALGWDELRNPVAPANVRTMHRGALACGLYAEDPQKLFASIGRLGLILSGKVESLSDFNFSDTVAAAQSLAEAAR